MRSVIEDGDTNLVAKRRLKLVEKHVHRLDKFRQGQLDAEYRAWIPHRAVPEQHVKLVVEKTGKDAFLFVADQLTEFRLGRTETRPLLLLLLRLGVRTGLWWRRRLRGRHASNRDSF